MPEFFVVANSFSAPFVSDQSTGYVTAETVEEALNEYAAAYRHPAGLYAAEAYASADDYHKGGKPLALWLSNHEIARRRAIEGKSSHTFVGHGPGHFEVNNEHVYVENPKSGQVVAA